MKPNHRHALVSAPLMPEFDRESGSRRVFQLIQLLQELGWRVTFVPENPGKEARYRRMLEQMGVRACRSWTDPKERLTDTIASGRFSLALFAFWYHAEAYAPRVKEVSPETTVIIDSVDLHLLRAARMHFRDRSGPSRLTKDFGDEAGRELSAYAAADGVLAVSRKEADLISDFCGSPNLAHHVPDFEELPRSRFGWKARRGSVFLGNFRHPPNVEAIHWLAQEIVPRLHDSPSPIWPLTIVGNGAEKYAEVFANAADVNIIGWVPAVEPYLERARVSLAPLLHGAGTKRKLIQSLMIGTPAVSTSVGVEGLSLEDGGGVSVRDDPASFAEAVGLLASNSKLWAASSRLGRAAVIGQHGRLRARQCLSSAVEQSILRAGRAHMQPRESGYTELVKYVRNLIEDTQMADNGSGPILVVSRGDPAFVDIAGTEAWHFPCDELGQYLGFYPASDEAAVEVLEAATKRGARALVIPRTAFWWLEHYPALHDRLNQRAVLLHRDEQCLIFRLA